MPKLKRYFFCSSCIAAMVLPAFSKALRTLRTSPCMSPTPSIDTRVEKITLRSWHISTTLVSIGMARCGVRPVVLMVSLRSFGNLSIISRQMSTMSLRVVGSPPERLAFSMSLPERRAEGLLDLRERHVFLAVAARPVAAHLAAGVAHERAMEDEDGGVQRGVLRHHRLDHVLGGRERRLGEILRSVDLCHLSIRYYSVSGPGPSAEQDLRPAAGAATATGLGGSRPAR